LNGSCYLLVEFAPGYVPPNTEAMLHEVLLLGVTPVIAHPERNRVLGSEPQKLGRLVEMGAVVQVTAGSITGEFGKWSRGVADELFRAGLVHVVASDAHDVTLRPPRLTQAREIVRKQWGAEAEDGLFEANPRAIVANQELPWRG
jgi:protein-tyrosine phosphatase